MISGVTGDAWEGWAMVVARRPGAYVCGIDAAMDVIGGKWKVLILWALDERACRFGELRRLVPGVTEKVLASHLRENAGGRPSLRSRPRRLAR